MLAVTNPHGLTAGSNFYGTIDDNGEETYMIIINWFSSWLQRPIF